MTYGQLWRASPQAWTTAGVGARRLAERVARGAAAVADQAGALGTVWRGAAADAAARRLVRVHDGLDRYSLPLIALDQALTEHAGRIAHAKAILAATVAAAGGTRVTVEIDGRVDLDRTGHEPDPGDIAAEHRTAAGIDKALALAARADAETAGRLAELGCWCRPETAQPPAWTPAAGSDAETVRAWWADLSPTQRRWAILHRPEVVGSLDGVPAAARDQANRLLLARLPDAAVDELRAWLLGAGRQRAYLLRLDERAGRAVVALGDPDLADHVLVHVPGAGATLDRIETELLRADHVLGRAAELAPGDPAAAVVWLDYAAPDCVGEVVRAASAHDAGPDLRRFVDGLRAAHAGPGPPHLTVLGHSYGSLVVGATARDHGLAADEVVFVGSAGAGVAHVDELRLPAEHVWSTTARQDPVQHLTPSLVQLARDAALSAAVPGYAGIAALSPDEDLWHGRNPSRPDFGGRVFASAPETPPGTAHSAYWETGNLALDNIARITLGGAYQAGVR